MWTIACYCFKLYDFFTIFLHRFIICWTINEDFEEIMTQLMIHEFHVVKTNILEDVYLNVNKPMKKKN